MLAGIEFKSFGILVTIGILCGWQWCRFRAKELKVSDDDITLLAALVLATGIFSAHVIQVVFYHPDMIDRDGPVVLLQVWKGLSSFGGFLGAFAGLWIYKLKKKRPVFRDAEITVEGLVIGWVFGRLGCTFADDHKGPRTDFVLGFVYPEGGRHNLGFYEFLYTLAVLVPTVLILRKRRAPTGTLTMWLAFLYGIPRFIADFFRATDIPGADIRYLGLTFAQYADLGLIGLGVALAFTMRSRTPKALRA